MSKLCMGCMKEYGDEFHICPHCGYVEGTKPEQPLHMEPGTRLRDRFIIGRSIGYGGFGVTYIAWDMLLQHRVAIKEYLPSEFSTRVPGVSQVTVYSGDKKEQFENGLSKFVDEAKRLAKLSNIDGIVKIYDSFEENQTAYIIMEYLEGETLASRLKRENTIPAEQAVELLLPVIDSLQRVHEQGIIHRDIAPDNLFLTKDGQVKVIDFGAARFATTSYSRSLSVIIKPGYSPEEQYRSRKKQGGYTDVYSVGATLYRMITGVTPPDALERYAKKEETNKDSLEAPSKYCKKLDHNTENAILNAMNIRVEDRTQSMRELREELTSLTPVKRHVGNIQKVDKLKWPLWAKIGVPVLAGLLLILGALFLTGVIRFESNLQTEIQIPDGMTRVPSVINDTVNEAEVKLEGSELLYSIIGKEYSMAIPADFILTQDLNGGVIVAQNSILQLTVSGGAEKREVPLVLSLSREEAVAAMEAAGFAVKIEEKYSTVVEVGLVISSSAENGTELEIGSLVTLTVSKGPDPDVTVEEKEIEIPDLVGKDYHEVLELAKAAGIKISIIETAHSKEFAKDQIMSQSPQAGTKAVTGDTVQITVSLGKEMIRVKDIQYQSEEEAKKVLEAQNLKVKITYADSESVEKGRVISQDPPAGTEVDPGTTVHLSVSKGAPAFAMPNVVGKAEADAKSILSAKGLSVTIDYENSDTVEDGLVLRQSISSGSSVKKGDTVHLVVSTGKPLCKVPDVVGMNSADAQKKLKKNGFKVAVNQIYDDHVPADQVISQSPADGTSHEKGTTVTLNVSKGKPEFPMPDVVGKPEADAKSILGEKGMSVSVSYRESDTVKAGLVMEQSISSGTAVHKGDKVNLVISTGIPIYDVPSVVGMSSADAHKKLKDSGFKVAVNEVYHNEIPAGQVISQTPEAGTSLEKGSTITVEVSKGQRPIEVTFDPNGGTISQTSKTAYSGSPMGDMPTPTREHHTFEGWYTAPDGGSQYTSDTVMSDETSLTLYAKWHDDRLYVSWNAADHCEIKVVRTSSPEENAPTGTLSSGDMVFNGDTLEITYTAESGYSVTDHGLTSATVSKNLTAEDIYATTAVNAYTVSWEVPAGATIVVKRTQSPKQGAESGSLTSGVAVYHGDVLEVSYQAAEGYKMTETGQQSITVSDNVGSSQIYAVTTPNEYTYRIVCRSTNGTDLGTSEVTRAYGSVHSISAPEKSGYNTPASQDVSWDSTGSKDIVFNYAPIQVSNGTQSGKLTDYAESGQKDPTVTYSASFEYRNRTSDSIEIRVTVSETIEKRFFCNNVHRVRTSVGDTSLGDIAVVGSWEWHDQVDHARTNTASTEWVRIPISTTGATSITIAAYFYDANANGTDLSGDPDNSCAARNFSWNMNIPAF